MKKQSINFLRRLTWGDCLVCNKMSPQLVCQPCLDTMSHSDSLCRSCALPISGCAVNHVCGPCQIKPPIWRDLHVLWPYQRSTQALIHRAKYRFFPHLARFLGKEMGLLMQPFHEIDPVTELVPVPLTRRRLATRHYNQAEQIAQGISKQLSIPVNTESLIRIKHSRKQALSVSASQRRANTRGAFICRRPMGSRIALIDDVLTTGATVESCIQAIQATCQTDVSVWCLARAC